MLALIAALILPFAGVPGFGMTVAAAGNPSANLDQCANGGVGEPEEQCSTTAWVNGNLNASKAHYLEGDSVPYRLRFDDLAPSSVHTVTIEWDTTKDGKHAIDHLTTFDRTETDADPVAGVSGIDPAVRSVAPIPADLTMQAQSDWSGEQVPGSFTMWGGSITDVSDYTYSGDWTAQTSARLTITFTANVVNPVLAWGGHIATRATWGAGRSAIAIPGSPYHMRLIDLDGKGGNQDRSLSEDAVIYPGSITVVKDATPASATAFPFVATGLTPSTFSLVDDAGGPGLDTQTFTGITTFGSYSVSESAVTGWTLTGISCSDPDEDSSVDLAKRVANVDLDEGKAITCTFTNTGPPVDLLPEVSVTKTAVPTLVPEAGGDVTFTFTVTNVGQKSFAITSLSDSVFGPLAGDDDCKVGTELAPGATCELSITRRLSGSASADHRNVLTAVVADREGNTDTATDDAVVQFTRPDGPGGFEVPAEPQIRVAKSPSASTIHEGDEVTYTYVVTNPGGVALRNVDVTDDRCGPVTYRRGDTDGDELLDVAETWRFECITSLSTTTRNTATATGRDELGRLVSDTDVALVTVIAPAIEISKTASVGAGIAGDEVTYEYVVTNPGDVHLVDVEVTDDRCSPVTYRSGDADGDEALDPDETWRYTCAAVLPDVDGPLTNVGTVTAVEGLGASVSASDDATVLVSRASGEPAVVEPDADEAPAPRQLAFTGFGAARIALAAISVLALGVVLVLLGRRWSRPSPTR